ncbi:hypothetical protein HanPI659440_Chr16g0640571 [Helianthus annuus]|nr:hypothetical protein HanPI659440_Chr16g0640571 [Helianthus annuus]
MSTKEWRKFDKLNGTKFLEHRTIDWEWLESVGARQRVEQLLGPKLIEAVNCNWDQYEELVLEFHNTFKHKEGTFAEHDAVSFILGRTGYEMDILRFTVATGFYTVGEARSPEFATSLRGAYQTPKEMSVVGSKLARFWSTTSDHPFASTNLITSVCDPVYRYLLKIFSTTLVGQKSRENKSSWMDLFILMCCVEQRAMNLVSVLAWSFTRTRRGGHQAALDIGPYITRIARNLGVFENYNPQHLHPGPTSALFGIKELQLAGIVRWTGPITWEGVRQGAQVQPPEGHLATDVMH